MKVLRAPAHLAIRRPTCHYHWRPGALVAPPRRSRAPGHH